MLQELESLVQLSKLTHRLLAAHLPLDGFEALFNEANMNVTSPYGRIALVTMFELSSQILPHYCYNGSTGRQVAPLSSYYSLFFARVNEIHLVCFFCTHYVLIDLLLD